MLAQLRQSGRQRGLTLSLSAQQALFAYGWPGNVRELNHVLRRAVALGTSTIVDASDLFPDAAVGAFQAPALGATRSLNEHLEQSERAFLMNALRRHNGAITEAAAGLGISRKTLWDKMRRYGIDKQQFGEGPEGSGRPASTAQPQ